MQTKEKHIGIVAEMLAHTLDCCSRETLENTESAEFGDLPEVTANIFYSQREQCFMAGANALPIICRYVKAVLGRLLKQYRKKSGQESGTSHLDDDYMSASYPLSLDRVLGIVWLLLKHDARGTACVFVTQGLCCELVDAVFLFKQSSAYQNIFRSIFGHAIIHASSQPFCEAMLAPTASLLSGDDTLYPGANMLERMVAFCERRIKDKQEYDSNCVNRNSLTKTETQTQVRLRRFCMMHVYIHMDIYQFIWDV